MPDPSTALADEYWQYRLSTDHFQSLWKGDLTYLGKWEDLSEEGVAARRRQLRSFAARAEQLAATSAPDALATLETISFTARSLDAQLEWRDEIEWVNPAIGIHSLLLTFLPRFPLQTSQQGEEYMEKLHRLPDLLEQLIARLRSGIAGGKVPILRAVTGTAAAIGQQLSLPPAEDPLTAQLPPTRVDPNVANTWKRRLVTEVSDVVRPALARFHDFLLTELAPAARPDDQPGMSYLPGGEEGYERLVWAHTSRNLTARQVHEIGLEQIERLKEEYRQLAGPVLGSSDVGEMYHRLREDESLRYQDGASLIADATTALARAEAKVVDWFGLLPEAGCVASEIDQGALAFYSRPAPDGSKPGEFFFNVSDPAAWARYQLEAVTYHESIPGHHLQIALAQELPDLHPLHTELYIAAFNEGWGLYSERLADEIGLYSSDLDRIGMLSADSMRACRLVVDTGMHGLGWSWQRAVDYMLDHSPMSVRQVEGEIDRYAGKPGQALGYMIGRITIDELRAEAEARLGERFSLPSFHDLVLGQGTVPLSTLRRRVSGWNG